MQKGPCPMSRGVAYLHQAQIAVRQGDLRKALYCARKAQVEQPDLAEAGELVARLGTG